MKIKSLKTGMVLDCSVTMAWCFQDEASEYTIAVLDAVSAVGAQVPSIWPLEVGNVLRMNEKKKRILPPEVFQFLELLSFCPIEVDESTGRRVKMAIYEIARETDTTIYDAAYLELAVREHLPLATLDQSLKKAAKKVGVSLL